MRSFPPCAAALLCFALSCRQPDGPPPAPPPDDGSRRVFAVDPALGGDALDSSEAYQKRLAALEGKWVEVRGFDLVDTIDRKGFSARARRGAVEVTILAPDLAAALFEVVDARFAELRAGAPEGMRRVRAEGWIGPVRTISLPGALGPIQVQSLYVSKLCLAQEAPPGELCHDAR